MDLFSLAIAIGIPSAITGFCFWCLELCIINCINASLALGEATAKAVQRIPDAKCNGDMHAALDYAQKVKHEQKDFLNSQALHQLY